jgi:CRISPR-associated protein Csm2
MPPDNFQKPQRPNTSSSKPTLTSGSSQSHNNQSSAQSQNASRNITTTIIHHIDQLTDGFGCYEIRALVKHAEEFGTYLQQNQLKTNQVRKFLDAVNQIKADLREDEGFSANIETEIVLLKPKLAYAAARQASVQPLSKVMSVAIDKVYNVDDFHRLVQFLESTIAYHKASGGKD